MSTPSPLSQVGGFFLVTQLEILPLETVCGILESLSPADLVKVMKVNKYLRAAVGRCTTTLEPGETPIPVPLLVSLPLVSRVNGFIKIRNEKDVVYVSQRFRGSLAIVGGDWCRYLRKKAGRYV